MFRKILNGGRNFGFVFMRFIDVGDEKIVLIVPFEVVVDLGLNTFFILFFSLFLDCFSLLSVQKILLHF
jgi:hypothetical protein